MLTKEDLELFDNLIKKNFETERIHTERLIMESERRTTEKIESAKEELRSEILASRAEAKADNLRLQGKIERVLRDHETRIRNLEEHTGTPNPNKH